VATSLLDQQVTRDSAHNHPLLYPGRSRNNARNRLSCAVCLGPVVGCGTYGSGMDRRRFLSALALGTMTALTACDATVRREPARAAVPAAGGDAAPLLVSAGHGQARVLDRLVGTGHRLALTVDDGVSSDVLAAYVEFVRRTGIRMTFFVNGVYDSWTRVRADLKPMVESGQVQLANHTWDHPSITGLSDSEIVQQLRRTEQFLSNTYGVVGAPYFLPPYGHHDARTDKVTGELGFDRTVLWWGSLGDAVPLSGSQILALARQWLVAERIVIGHANHPGVTTVFDQLIELIRSRRLRTVTLHDVFA